jgi:hypothetical protein
MAKTATTTARAPRGTKVVAEAFLTAVDDIPEPRRADVVKAALALIRDRLKGDRDKAKLAQKRPKAKGATPLVPSKNAGAPRAAAKQTTASPKAKKTGAKVAVRRRNLPQMKAPEPAPTPSDETAMPNDGVTR